MNYNTEHMRTDNISICIDGRSHKSEIFLCQRVARGTGQPHRAQLDDACWRERSVPDGHPSSYTDIHYTWSRLSDPVCAAGCTIPLIYETRNASSDHYSMPIDRCLYANTNNDQDRRRTDLMKSRTTSKDTTRVTPDHLTSVLAKGKYVLPLW